MITSFIALKHPITCLTLASKYPTLHLDITMSAPYYWSIYFKWPTRKVKNQYKIILITRPFNILVSAFIFICFFWMHLCPKILSCYTKWEIVFSMKHLRIFMTNGVSNVSFYLNFLKSSRDFSYNLNFWFLLSPSPHYKQGLRE